VLSIHSSAAKEIAHRLNIDLSEDQEKHFTKPRKVDPETYKAYLTGMSYLNQGTTESFEKGISYLHKAINLDPSEPFAYAGLALGYAMRGHALIATRESFRSAEAAANKALRIDPTSDEAYLALAFIYQFKYWDWPRAQKAFENAIASNPNNEIAHANYAWFHIMFGDLEKSIHHAETAVILEPYSATYNAWLAWLYFMNEDYEQAELFARKSLELHKDINFGKLVLGWVYMEQNKYQEAIELHEQLPKTRDYYLNFLGYTYIVTGYREKAEALWNECETVQEGTYVNPVCKGMLAGMLGYDDKAFELLNEAFEKQSYPLIHIECLPLTDNIRNDPSYEQLLRKMNLPAFRTRLAMKSELKQKTEFF
jgi:Tfp pilus assembly protein PilF